MVQVAVVGCAHGKFDAIYAHIEAYNESAAAPIELLLCCGDVETLRNETDLECLACPIRYRHMNEFHEYYSGTKHAPVLTIVIGGNHEASNYFQELHYGGWVAPNIFYLGAAGVVNVMGLRIGGISGIYDPRDYQKGHYESVPYSKKELYSVFHTREMEVFQLSHVTQPIDIMMSHDWPRKIEDHGDTETLLQMRPSFRESKAMDNFGSVAGEELLARLQPRHWLAGHMHVRFEAEVAHAQRHGKTTKFLALDKCHRDRPWFEVLNIQPTDESLAFCRGSAHVYMDTEWLAALRATHSLASTHTDRLRLPASCSELDVDWITARLAEKRDGDRAWIAEFTRTAPSHGCQDERTSDTPLGNPQTDALLELLDLAHRVTSPYRPDGDSDEEEEKDEWSWSDGDEGSSGSGHRSTANDAFLESFDPFSTGGFKF